MSRGREPANRVASPTRARNHGNWVRGVSLVVVVHALGSILGCSSRNEGAASGVHRPSQSRGPQLSSPFGGKIGHVGNQVRGIDAMPDYDAQAAELRARVTPRLPDPLPSPKAACVTMLDAARQFYLDTEGEDALALQTMAATRTADLTACEQQTPPAAAACVAVLLSANEGEFPWLLDQCSRAFASADAP